MDVTADEQCYECTCSTSAAAPARAAARSASSVRTPRCMTQAAAARRWYCGRQPRCITTAARLQCKRKASCSRILGGRGAWSGLVRSAAAPFRGVCTLSVAQAGAPECQEAGPVPEGGCPRCDDVQRGPLSSCLCRQCCCCLRTQRCCLLHSTRTSALRGKRAISLWNSLCLQRASMKSLCNRHADMA